MIINNPINKIIFIYNRFIYKYLDKMKSDGFLKKNFYMCNIVCTKFMKYAYIKWF